MQSTSFLTLAEQQLWVPTEFALAQITNLNIPQSLEKLRWLHEKLLHNTLMIGQDSLHLTNALTVTVHDILEMFAGDYFDQITPHGVQVLKAMHDQHYLPMDGPKTDFPLALITYMNSDQHSPVAFNDGRLSQVFVDSEAFTYRNLFYLFDSVVGSKRDDVILKVGNTNVTRKTKQLDDATDAAYQTVFIWENEACRTLRLTRNGYL